MSVEQILLDSQAVAAAFAASRLLSCGSAREQRSTFSYLLVTAASSFILSNFRLASSHYFWWFLGCVTATDVVAVLAVRELFSLSVAGYPGIRTAVRNAVYAGLG